MVDAIGTLSSYALLSRRVDSKVFDKYSLVYVATRIKLQERKRGT